MLLDGEELPAEEIARRREETLGHTLYHLKVLHRRGALVARARRQRSATLYSFSEQARWARKMLGEGGEFGEPGP